MKSIALVVGAALLFVSTQAFTTSQIGVKVTTMSPSATSSSALFMTDDVKAAPMVTGEELEMMLTEWDLPLVVDAYATWYVFGTQSEGGIRFVAMFSNWNQFGR
jgi:hypothetical protein